MFSPEILKGTIKPLLIKLISDNGRMYGYQITQMARERSGGAIAITEGALYPALHKLVQEGILKVETEFVSGRERKYYSLSGKGRQAAKEKLEEVGRSIEVLVQVFELRPSTYGA